MIENLLGTAFFDSLFLLCETAALRHLIETTARTTMVQWDRRQPDLTLRGTGRMGVARGVPSFGVPVFGAGGILKKELLWQKN